MSSKTPEILIIDDLPANLKVLGDILEDDGYKVRPVRSGKQALQVAEKVMPDLILLDVLMPGIDGFEVCRRLKESQKLHDIPVIFISARDDSDDIVKALNTGGIDYITRPFRAEEVTARVSAHLKDYQQRKIIEEQSKELQILNVRKDKFFSIIAHDLRNPISGFLGLTQLLIEELPSLSQAEILDIACNLRNTTANIYGLLENLFQWSRMEQGLIPFKPANMQLKPVVDVSLSLVLESARIKDIEITKNVPDNIHVFADSNMLQSVFRNLVSNSVKFTPRGGKIYLSAKTLYSDRVQISIKDSGIGISAEMVDNLFRLDGQTDRPGTDGEPSTGLGLIICREFVEKHNGKLWVASEEGKGSEFFFDLPISNLLKQDH